MTIFFEKLPRRPYDSFGEYLKNQPGYKEGVNEYPCFTCDGEGRYFDPDDRDPYEGFKMASKRRCPTCGGTGKQSPEYHKSRYKEELADWRKRRNRIMASNTLLRKALRKARNALTLQEFKALELHDVRTLK